VRVSAAKPAHLPKRNFRGLLHGIEGELRALPPRQPPPQLDGGARLPATMLSDRFRAAVEQGDVHRARELFHENAVFLSPVVFEPYEGRDQVLRVLQAAERGRWHLPLCAPTRGPELEHGRGLAPRPSLERVARATGRALSPSADVGSTAGCASHHRERQIDHPSTRSNHDQMASRDRKARRRRRQG
jgi:hypothetical protein